MFQLLGDTPISGSDPWPELRPLVSGRLEVTQIKKSKNETLVPPFCLFQSPLLRSAFLPRGFPPSSPARGESIYRDETFWSLSLTPPCPILDKHQVVSRM